MLEPIMLSDHFDRDRSVDLPGRVGGRPARFWPDVSNVLGILTGSSLAIEARMIVLDSAETRANQLASAEQVRALLA